jgi:hypothetical protein
MRSAGYSLFTTLMLLVAVAAVPLMAIFGVPRLAPPVPSALDDDAEEEWDRPVRGRPKSLARPQHTDEPEIELAVESAPDWDRIPKKRIPRPRRPSPFVEMAASAPGDSDVEVPFAETQADESPVAAKRNRRPKPVRDEREDQADGIQQVGHEFAPDEASEEILNAVAEIDSDGNNLSEEAGSVPPAPSGLKRYRRADSASDDLPHRALDRRSQSAQPPTWNDAVQRLNDLGIRNFRLEHLRQGEFSFTCSYTHSNSPNVTRRFEAEADEPLKAVGKVLAQVEDWSEQREQAPPRQMLPTGERRRKGE